MSTVILHRGYPGSTRQPGVAQNLALWARRRRQRLRLAALDDRLLADIGITRDQAREEARKPFWQA